MIRSALVRRNSQYLQCLIGEQAIQAWDECRRRRRYTSTNTASSPPRTNDTDAATSSTTNSNISSLCQMNNHPDFRLRRKKEEMAAPHSTNCISAADAAAAEKITMKQQQVQQWHMNENPIRSNDGTSSGALAADRLRLARRKAMETMIETFPARRTHKVVKRANNLQQHQQQHTSYTILPINENPIRSNDGTSSGALVADRLRMARRTAMASISDQHRAIHSPDDDDLELLDASNASAPSSKAVHVIENPDRPSDGTSSGALAADRLRMARRKAIESLNTQSLSKK